jgi:hypothetical protein
MVGSCYVHNATSYEMLLKNGLTSNRYRSLGFELQILE